MLARAIAARSLRYRLLLHRFRQHLERQSADGEAPELAFAVEDQGGWVAGGLVAGAFDIVYACAFWWWKAGVPPRRIFQSVAAGLLGPASFEGGASTAALGLGLHFFNAFVMSVAYYLAAARWPLLRRRPVLCGAGYGFILSGVMNYVVVPLSSAGPGSKDPLWIALSVAVHVLLVGIPIALIIRLAHPG